MTSEPVWEAPPDVQGGPRAGTVWERRLAPLRNRPGQWARVTDTKNSHSAYSVVANLRLGRTQCPPGFEFKGGRHPDDPNRGAIWARYVGPTPPEDTTPATTKDMN